eukprot:jgi/Bigna1/89106/estExt_fgenesh1_pg.C_430120
MSMILGKTDSSSFHHTRHTTPSIPQHRSIISTDRIVKVLDAAAQQQHQPPKNKEGHALAWEEYRSADIGVSFLFWIFAVLTQIGTNLHNDYADFVKGADTNLRVGPARATQKGWIQPKTMAKASSLILAAAIAVGIQLVSMGGGLPVALAVFACIFGAVAYTGGPYPLGAIGLGHISIAYAGLGDVFTMFYFGLVPVLATYYLNTGFISATAIGFSLIMGSFASAIITVNNIRDVETDKAIGKKTSAVRYGVKFAKREYGILMVASFALLPVMWMLSLIPAPWMFPLIAFIMADKEIREVFRLEGAKLNKCLFGTARVQIIFTLIQLFAMYNADRVREVIQLFAMYNADRVREVVTMACYDFYVRMFLTVDPLLAMGLKMGIFFGYIAHNRRQRGQDPLNPYARGDQMD